MIQTNYSVDISAEDGTNTKSTFMWLSKKVIDIFVNKNEIKIFTSKRIKTNNTHGTGCTLSTAITSFYSCGKTLKNSCELGIKYVNSAILTNPKIGKGHGPINHLNSIKLERNFI